MVLTQAAKCTLCVDAKETKRIDLKARIFCLTPSGNSRPCVLVKVEFP